MSNAYASWGGSISRKLESYSTIFMSSNWWMNAWINIRRRYAVELDASQRNQFKKLRMLFLWNMEDQDEASLLILRNMRKHFTELRDAYMLKEALRSIYATASNALEARAAFRRWATLAAATGSREFVAMAKTIREKLSGIITYWTFDRMSNASTEGFNNKIRWLIRQAYGFRDITYLKLKIFQLPSIQPQKKLWFMAQNGEEAEKRQKKSPISDNLPDVHPDRKIPRKSGRDWNSDHSESKLVAGSWLEHETCGLWFRRSNQLS